MATQAIRRSLIPEAASLPATTAWPIAWSAAFVGGLAALTVLVLTGLIGVAIGAHQLSQGAAERPLGFWSLLYTVASAFFAFVVAGWVAGKINGDRRSETTALHGAVVWLLSVPAMVLLLALGSGSLLGPWYGGLGRMSAPAYAAQELRRADVPSGAGGAPAVVAPTARAQQEARAARNAALGGATALLLGLAGSVLGGWMASGEPMSLRYRRPVDTSYPA